MWIEREIESSLAEVAASRPAVIVTGCRQSGKTSLLTRSFPEHGYVSLDVPAVAEEAEFSGESFLSRHRPPVIIDEVQYAPALLRYVKANIDAHRDQMGRFLITGSQRFPLMEGVTESLAGRAAIVPLHTLSAREFASWSGEAMERPALLEWIVRGGYPELHARSLDHERFYADYLATYIERDVRSVLNVRSLRDFDRFMRLCATRTGQLLSYNSLASDVGVSPNTIKAWFSVLEASGIVHLLEPFHRNLGKRLIKTPKLYFLDTGLACFLLGLRSRTELERSTMLGPLFETHVLGQIVRHFANRIRPSRLYFYRDRHGTEVDFLLPVGDRLHLVECKVSDTPPAQPRGFAALRALAGDAAIVATTIVTPALGMRQAAGGVTVGDSVELGFLE